VYEAISVIQHRCVMQLGVGRKLSPSYLALARVAVDDTIRVFSAPVQIAPCVPPPLSHWPITRKCRAEGDV